MYSVYAGSTCIYDDTSNDKSLRLIAPTLELADSAAGSFKMTVPVTNAGYNLIERLKTYITVMKDGEEMWEGRVIDESIDFWKNRTLTCEGELAYLNDSTQPPAEYHDLTVRGFLETLIQIHNSKVSEERRFIVGAVTVTDPNDSLYRYTNYEKTIECINDKLVNRLGGHLVVRKENGVRYLDYLADKLSTSTQIIEFGTNLLDYTASFDMTEYATVVVPLGERLEESPISALEAYTTVASVNDGSIYVQNEEAVASYGWIEKVVHFDRVTQPANLLRKAQQYLSDLQFDNMILEVKAVDLHYMNPEIEGVKLSDQIRVISQPHGLNKVFPVMKLSIPLDQPENTLFTLGTKIQTSLTAENNKVNSEVKQRIEAMPTKQSVLDEARDNATEIMDLISNGYITITHGQNGSEELYISDTQDLTQATRWWRWNVNGLAYYNTNMGSTSPVLAMTMDGSIVADRITTGTLRADLLDAVRIKASTFILENESDPTEPGETLQSAFQRFVLSDQQLSSQIGGLTQVAVKKVEVYYALGNSQTQAPGDSANWSTTAPAWESGKYMWQKTLTIFADDTVATPHRSWSAATCIQGAKGENGNNGYNTAVVSLYKRSETPVTTIDWSGTLTYYFTGQNAHHLNSVPTGWSESIPSGDDPLYVTAATAYSNTGSDAIAATDWSAPIKMAENGSDGDPGRSGYNSATVFLYQRSASVPTNKPSGDLTYTFATGALSGTFTPWEQKIPTTDGNPCYVIQATAVSVEATDTIPAYEWSEIRMLVEDGTDGDDGVGVSRIVPEYAIKAHTTPAVAPTTGWSETCPAWQEGYDIWTRSHVYYDNGDDTTTTAVLDNAVNGLGQSYTEIKQDMQSISLTASTDTTTEEVNVDAGSLVNAQFTPEDDSKVYQFEKNENRDWISTNAGVANSLSYGMVLFNFEEETKVILRCECHGEANYDYGIVSNLDVSLTVTRTRDSSGVKHSFESETGGTVVDLEYTIPSGAHRITFKYVKDSSSDGSGDYFKVHAYKVTEVITSATSKITLSGNGITAKSANIDLTGYVTFNDLLSEGQTIINGANIQTGTIEADRVKTKELWYNDHRILYGDSSHSSGAYMDLNNGIRDSTLGDIFINYFATMFRFIDKDSTNDDEAFVIDAINRTLIPGGAGVWWLGDRDNYLNRIYLGDRAYIWVDSNGDLNYTYGRNTYTLAPNV